MKIAPLPSDEEERLAALADYQILDTAAESIFDQITEIASKICGVPISLISLIDSDRQWFKSNFGMGDSKESSRDTAFCAHAILDDKLMEIKDATKDDRFSDNPFVLESPNIRFYAGMPLINPRGFKLGTLCVIDKEPKSLSDTQKEILEGLSKLVIKFFEIKKAIVSDVNQRKLASEALGAANSKLKRKLAEQKQSRQELLLLGEMSSVLQACMTAEEAYVAITKFCRQLFPETRGVLYLLNTNHDHSERIASWGDGIEQEDFFSLEECWALRRGQTHVVSDPKTDLVCKHMQVYEEKPRYICVPLMAQGEILGLLTLEFLQEATKQITETQRLLALAMAEQVALALANAKLRETLHQQSVRDPLTGLYNRRYLTDTLKHDLPRFLKKSTPLAFLLFDIDFFKKFNDTYGHDAGDAVLKHAATLLETYAVANHGQACRFGGEEFIVVLENASKEDALKHAEFLREQIQKEQIKYNGTPLNKITFSIGVALFSEHGKTIDELFNAADTALYQAKENGRNQVVLKK